jgi:hypothetical protein
MPIAVSKVGGQRFRKLCEQLSQILLILGKAIVGTVFMGDKPIQTNGDKISQVTHGEPSRRKGAMVLTVS